MNKVVIITGASSGIGLATAKYLKERGCTVYGISLHNNSNLDFENFACDVNNTAGIVEIFDKIYAKEGKIDVLINNAGFGIAGAIEETKEQNIQAIVNTNLNSVITLSSKIIPYLKKSGGGNIVNISSVGGIIALPFQACYSATKAGVETFSKALAIEVKPFNIKVTAILPGDTNTGFTSARVIDQAHDKSNSDRMTKSINKMANDERNGKSPISVAKVIYKVLKRKNPPLRKAVGFVSKVEVFLTRIFPTKFINYIVAKMYG